MTSPYFFWNKAMEREADRGAYVWSTKARYEGSASPTSSSSSSSARSRSPWSILDRSSTSTAPSTPTKRRSIARAEDELIVVPVRLTTPHRWDSILGSEELPERPPPRSWLRRLKTRICDSEDDGAEYRIVKMPRAEYRRFFARGRKGEYAGTEPEREWDEEGLREVFGRYQGLPVRYEL